MLKASDIMTREVVTLSPLMDVEEAARFLTQKRISGAPVVDSKGRLLGVVSQTDLTRFQGGHGFFDDAPERNTPVVAIMTDYPITCEEETSVDEIARIMLERRVHRLIVVWQGKIRGIVTAMDLLRAREQA